MNKLDQLKTMTKVVADTGDIDAMRQYQPEDATTNPSLLLKAAAMPRYSALLQSSIAAVSRSGLSDAEQKALFLDEFAVRIGAEILSIVPGVVSTEIDARLSFNTKATVERGKQLLERYQQQGIDPARVLLKIASTWEGIEAARQLEKQGIHCNLTLLFGFSQAVAAAEAGAFLISPFVGRILDWFKASTGQAEFAPLEDPGVLSVTRIYNYYKQHGYGTVVMGASFRNAGEIEALAGCDRLTIAPALLETLSKDQGTLVRRLSSDQVGEPIAREEFPEAVFRYALNADAMATEKLAEGIRNFVADQITLEQELVSLAGAAA